MAMRPPDLSVTPSGITRPMETLRVALGEYTASLLTRDTTRPFVLPGG